MNNKKITKNEIKELNEIKEIISKKFKNLNLDIETLKIIKEDLCFATKTKYFWYSIYNKKRKKMELIVFKDLDVFCYQVILRDSKADVIADSECVDSNGYVIVNPECYI